MGSDTDGTDRRRLAARLRDGTGVLDVVALGTVPLLLCLLFLLPTELRDALVFDYHDPGVLTAFASVFVHRHLEHLAVNVGAYLLVVPVTYALSAAGGTRRGFYTAFATFLFAFPAVLAYANLAVPRLAVSNGFSGVVMAFLGYLPVALADYLDGEFDIGPKSAVAQVLFFLGLALASVLSLRSLVPGNTTVALGATGLVVVAVLGAVLYLLPVLDRGIVVESAGPAGALELAVVGLVLFFSFPFVAYPAAPAGDGRVLNLYVHLLGYALGFLVTYTSLGLTRRVEAVGPGN
jgi:hypothetical protein